MKIFFSISFRYKQCFDEAQKGFMDPLARDKGLTKDDRAHGSLLVLQELLRCSNAEGERLLAQLEQLNLLHSQSVQVPVDSLKERTMKIELILLHCQRTRCCRRRRASRPMAPWSC